MNQSPGSDFTRKGRSRISPIEASLIEGGPYDNFPVTREQVLAECAAEALAKERFD
jgi:hypothetical protein